MESKKNIQSWEALYTSYSELEKASFKNIDHINDIKKNLLKLLVNQKKDDITFYKSIIDNSHFYLTNSIKIRKAKFINDLNYIWNLINNSKQMDDLTKTNFTSLLKDYDKMAKDIMYSREHNTPLTWVKNDMVESLEIIEKDMNEIMKYHLNMLEYIFKMTELEKNFYCSADKNSIDVT